MMAVLTGSLLLGDSVRGTLVQRVSERLGRTETAITSGTGFMNETLLQHPLMKNARGWLLMDGYVSVGDKLLPVYVWGTDADTLQAGEVMVNEPLRAQLGNQEDLVLHLPSHNLVPSGSLFVTKSYATQMRLHVVGVKSVEEGGNLLLKNEQTLPLNVFVNRRHLAEKMELEGKINMVFSDDCIEEEQLAACWTPEQSGIHLTDTTLTCDGVFIPQNIVEKLSALNSQPSTVNCQLSIVNCQLSTLYLSYFVNDLIHDTDTIPYSFVTAVNEWQGDPLEGQDIILSDYAARRLHVQEGDSVSMSYFITRQLKNLDTKAQMLRVKKIVPLAAFMQDSLLMADFPGLTRVEKCTDWDSDLPIDMNRVHTERPEVSLLPHDADVQLYHPRAQGLKGATGGVDFAGLFLSLGFFIILSSVLLMKNPLVEMFTQRQGEIQLYQQLGFKDKDIRKGLFKEAFSVILLASPWGVLAGFAYSTLTLWLLGNVWSGATHTEGFVLHVQPLTLIIGVLIGLLICALTLWWVIRSQLSALNSQPSALNPQPSALSPQLSTLNSILLLLTLSLIVVNFIYLHNMVLFIVCGLLWILTWGLFLRHELQRPSSAITNAFNRKQLIRQSVRASLKQHLLAYWTLSLGVFTVFAVGLNRPDFSQALQATGGYQFYVDSRVPIQYDLNNPSVRHKLSLQSLPDSTRFLGFLRHTQDEASCLNLNQVSTPTVLGVNLKEMETFGLTPDSQLSTLNCQLYLDEEALTWSLMKSVGDTLFYQSERGDSVPVVIAGTYPTGIFHGNAIMSSEDFRRLWPKEGGWEVLLMKSSRPKEAAEILSIAMNEYGLNVQTVEERIKMFFEVTETYLIIFLTLGGLGLLLGVFSLMIIVRKNLTAQLPTIRQYRATGFSEPLIRQLLLHENLLVPFYAICVGAIGSIISISANPGGAGLTTLLLALVVLMVICFLLYYGVKYMVNQTINNIT